MKMNLERLIDCLTQQKNELDLLKSMYPNHGEIVVSNEKIIADISNFIDNKTDFAPANLDFTVNLKISTVKLEVCINLPHMYPDEEPVVYVRCNQLNRQQETLLNKSLSQYVKQMHEDDSISLYSAILWLQENIDNYFTLQRKNPHELDLTEDLLENVEKKFARLWIYSHHIYNKRKRQEIVSKAICLGLTGFCVPGKPGIVCVEGLEENCKEWWKDIKSMTWKKIMIRKTEIFDETEFGQHKKFENFEEIYFQNSNSSSSSSKHADMSGLSKYLENVGLTQEFSDFFGLCSVR